MPLIQIPRGARARGGITKRDLKRNHIKNNKKSTFSNLYIISVENLIRFENLVCHYIIICISIFKVMKEKRLTMRITSNPIPLQRHHPISGTSYLLSLQN